MNADDLLARPCIVCDRAYGEHSLDDLAGCMESLTEGFDDSGYIEDVPTGRYL